MIRQQMGTQIQTFDFCLSLLEPLNRDISEELAHHGIHNNMIPPRLIAPWLLQHQEATRHNKKAGS